MVDAAYGAAGYIESGQNYDRRDRARLAESYRLLEHALTLLKNDGTEGMAAYLVLLSPYLSDPADPSLVAEWRKNPNDQRTGWHDLAISKLADYLAFKDLYVIWPARMSAREERQMERRNSEFFALYQRIKAELRDAGRSETKANSEAVATAAIHCGYSKRRGYEIVQAREGRRAG